MRELRTTIARPAAAIASNCAGPRPSRRSAAAAARVGAIVAGRPRAEEEARAESSARLEALSAAVAGKNILKVVPTLTWLWTSIQPWCCLTMP